MQHQTQLETTVLHDLVERSGLGDTEAFGRLYDALYDRLYSYAFKRTFDETASQDITANSFYHIMTHIQSFRWQDEPRFYAWVFRITMNEIASYYRKDKKYVLTEDWLDIEDASDDESQYEKVIENEQSRLLHEAVDRLPNKLQQVVELYYFAGQSHADIALTLGIKEGAARVRLHRAVEMLHTNMQGEEYAYRG
ncbi:MAG: RNA polymerase sigma factor [Candidatus Saccharimonadales bacterium]